MMYIKIFYYVAGSEQVSVAELLVNTEDMTASKAEELVDAWEEIQDAERRASGELAIEISGYEAYENETHELISQDSYVYE